MFESITFFNQNKTDTSNPLDIGALVECMLFYGKTSVVANQNILKQLFTYFGVDRVIEIIKEDLLNIIYTETSVGGYNTNNKWNRVSRYRPVFISPTHVPSRTSKNMY